MSPLLVLPGLTLSAGANRSRHLHAGPPAAVGTVELRVEATAPHTLAGQGLVLLHADCSEPDGTWPDRTALPIVETWWTPDQGDRQPVTGALTAAGTGGLLFTFARQELYQACDRWAVDVALAVDGAPTTVRVPLEVVRVEPLRAVSQ